ncbi:VWA domain-containing protein [Nakamurella flava]|uniref:Mg-protoporphyrin IX chelatase n=1 Tax=Nakamurella flava TaxID=2576308 RepID=A0A4U6QFU7_9ACTN|nr:VWA domain-containing protein [Nakamurella flava]
MRLALLLCAVSPAVGGVLVRGEKGTAKSTTVRALAALLPGVAVVRGCRFSCDPSAPDPHCPDRARHADGPDASTVRSARLVELPVGATEDRVIGSLHLEKALTAGVTEYEPGLLAAAHRGLLYVDEVNLLHDHLVDLLLDAAAMGRSTVEREGVSIAHAASFVLVGTMNPEEGELRPQLLDRFGLTVEIRAPREPVQRAEVVRRRLAFDADPAGFSGRFADAETDLAAGILAARERLPAVVLDDWALTTIATVCAGFEVDGLRADIVTARAAVAHAAWAGRTGVGREDIRAAARLALPHRRRRNPFDAPGLDEDLLDRLLDDCGPEPEPDPDPSDGGGPDGAGDQPDASSQSSADDQPDSGSRPSQHPGAGEGPSDQVDSSGDAPVDHTAETTAAATASAPAGADPAATAAPVAAGTPYRPKLFTVAGLGAGAAGRRSRALTSLGRTVGVSPEPTGPLHLTATIRAAAPHQRFRGRQGAGLLVRSADVRRAAREGRESNLILFCVDASGSMAARRRMEQVKTAVLSLLLDAYQRRDKVGLITFRGADADLALPATTSVDVAARRLADLPTGGRTPLAEGLVLAADTLRREAIRDSRRRPLLVLVSDGRATSGPDAVARSQRAATGLAGTGVTALVIDCETGRFRLGLAARLAGLLDAQHVPLDEVAAEALTTAVRAQVA